MMSLYRSNSCIDLLEYHQIIYLFFYQKKLIKTTLFSETGLTMKNLIFR